VSQIPDAEPSRSTDVTRLLSPLARGRPEDRAELSSAVYEELRAMARRYMGGERSDHTLQATALVSEAYLRLVGDPELEAKVRETIGVTLLGLGPAGPATRRRRRDSLHGRGRSAPRMGRRVMEATNDASYACPACGEQIVVPLDPSAGRVQEYVEDCPVCCHPVVLRVVVDGEEAHIEARAE